MIVNARDYSGPQEFAALHVHSCYSTLDGIATPQEYADSCQKMGQPAMAITEHGHMASVPDIYTSFKKNGLKALIGCELYYNDFEPIRQKLTQKGHKPSQIKESLGERLYKRISSNRHLTVLAKNEIGVHNLIKLTTLASQFGAYGKYPRTWFEKIAEYKEGLIVLSGCLNGPASHEIRLDAASLIETGKPIKRCSAEKTAIQYIKLFKEAFGEDFFIEVQMPCLPEIYDDVVFKQLMEIADGLKIKAVLTNDTHYLRRDDHFIQKVMMAVEQKKSVFDPTLFHVNSSEQYLKSRAELWETFKSNKYSEGFGDSDFEQICDNTLLVAERCKPLKPDTTLKIPKWEKIENGKNADEELKKLVYDELKRRGWDTDTRKFVMDGKSVTYREQAEIELDRFINKGFASYFLITRDLVLWGKKQGWPFGPRGSCGGSLVCYLLNITTINPLLWGCSFDRFLSPARGGYLLNTRLE